MNDYETDLLEQKASQYELRADKVKRINSQLEEADDEGDVVIKEKDTVFFKVYCLTITENVEKILSNPDLQCTMQYNEDSDEFVVEGRILNHLIV